MRNQVQKLYSAGVIFQAISTGLIFLIAQFNKTESFNGLQAAVTIRN
jgi:hypothetical protein